MSLVHDLAESIVGDITPMDNVTKEEKREAERVRNFLKPNYMFFCFQCLKNFGVILLASIKLVYLLLAPF
jgi:hypothetical protein